MAKFAKEFNVQKSNIRFCEEKGLISLMITKWDQRVYNKHDRARLNLIFHCALIDYTRDQIIELIGIPAVDLDEMEQIRKSLEYGEKKLNELEKRSKDLKFPERTRVMNEMNMMREYVAELKAIKPEIVDEPAAKPHIDNKERKEAAPKPVETIKPETEKKPKQRPIGMIPVYVAGLALVLTIVCYFYYQDGKKETKRLYIAQKEQPKIVTCPVYRDSVPSDDTGDQQGMIPLSSETSTSPLPIQQDGLIKVSKELVDKEPIKGRAETIILLSKAAPKPISLPPVVSVSKDVPSAPDKKEAVRPQDKQTLDTQINEDTVIKLQQLYSSVAQLTRAVVSSDEKNQTDDKPLTWSYVEKRKSNTVQDKTQPHSYNVSLHYTSEKNKELMEYLAILLQLEGFGVLGLAKVDYQNTDIRYFHSEDKAGALLLQKYSTEFITPFMDLDDTNIKIKDLGQKYPNVRKGVLELWVNNKFLR